ncbi:MAG TPA: type II toxin-antitoxin system HipA family toxin [Planctomycetes bacterium]|nr:type II toxin-antitoxin system HipA family toxin [Planctomycetota bacterium]
MDEVSAYAEVKLWGRTVGAVAELATGRIVFEYDDVFRRSGLEISPFHLPLSVAGPRTFDELLRRPGFQGLPGVLADSLPDAFGNRVIRAYFAARGQEERALSPVQRLLYVGERGIGALTFHPATDVELRHAESEALAIADLVQDARRIVEGEPAVTVPEIYRIGSSAGGMRPKAVVLFNPATREIRSAYATPQPGDVPALLKFDGVGDGAQQDRLGQPSPFNRVEAAYGKLARTAGIDMEKIIVLETDGYAHLVIPRFDIAEGRRRRHQHSLGGLLHVDFNEPGAASYEEYLRAILRLGMTQSSVEEGYRRMVFNVLAVNQDDHVKNLSFHMDASGDWSLTPAYDVTFARGRGWTAEHQMRVQDKTRDIRLSDLLRVANLFGIRRARRFIDAVAEALTGWENAAAECAVPAATVRTVRAALDARWRELNRT